jgi:hypothetical protein
LELVSSRSSFETAGLELMGMVASQTLGEEYVEILPYAIKRSNFPSRIVRPYLSSKERSSKIFRIQRRILSVLSLALIPSIWRHLCKSLTPTNQSSPETRRTRLARLLNNEWIQRLPEGWFIWFLLRGRNVEWSKSLWGMRYVSFAFWFDGGWWLMMGWW